MKVIALVSFRNESWILPTMLSSLAEIADEVLGYDDFSSDGSGDVFQNYGGQLVPLKAVRPYSEGGEYDFRQGLLAEGRARKGTHFLVIDADEALSANFADSCRRYLAELVVGQQLSLQWATLWGNPSTYRCEVGPWFPSYKPFFFRDGQGTEYPRMLMHLPRTPSKAGIEPVAVPLDCGVMLHYQFASLEAAAVKQAWYRCIERIRTKSPARRINAKYQHEHASRKAELCSVPEKWDKGLPQPSLGVQSQAWRLDEVLVWFEEYGLEFFEPLDIWRVPELHEYFLEAIGRPPRAQVRTASALAGLRWWKGRLTNRSSHLPVRGL